MLGAIDQSSISATEAASLFGDLAEAPALLLAVSGGPDSTALLWLAARWRRSLKRGPLLVAATVDHGLRKGSRREAAAVARLAAALKIPHRTLRWTERKPATGIQEAAREARCRLLGRAAKAAGATHIVMAHTRDDQAETVLMRMARGSGIAGLAAMRGHSQLDGTILARPFLDVPKARLIATLRQAKIAYADDPSNADIKFTRVRLRHLLPALAAEGLDARRLSTLANRLRRADAAIEAGVDRAWGRLVDEIGGRIALPAAEFSRLPAEIALRLIARAIDRRGHEGPAELAKLETLFAAVLAETGKPGKTALRRTLAGALVSVSRDQIAIEAAPLRRPAQSLTKRRPPAAKRRKTR